MQSGEEEHGRPDEGKKDTNELINIKSNKANSEVGNSIGMGYATGLTQASVGDQGLSLTGQVHQHERVYWLQFVLLQHQLPNCCCICRLWSVG